MSRDEDGRAESRRILNRVGPESEASMATRARDHMTGRDAQDKDWAELWGTRIGRWLGLVLLIYLLWWLFSFVVEGG